MIFDAATFLPSPRPLGPSLVTVAPEKYHDVHWDHRPLARKPIRARGAKLAGLRYEQRVADVLAAIYGGHFLRSPRILYRLGGRLACAIPDGILYLSGTPVIIEVKLAHTELVWEQLMERYLPLVSRLHAGKYPRAVEVCRSYDPAINVPHSLITSLHKPSDGLEVLQWRI